MSIASSDQLLSASAHFLVGLAGHFPLMGRCPASIRWQQMPGRRSPQSYNEEIHDALLEQAILPEHNEPLPASLRVTICGTAWYGHECFGRDILSLYSLQMLLDMHWPACLERFEGDFVLCYIPPDYAQCCFYRGVTATHTIYYRFTNTTLLWSTAPQDLFEHGMPTLDDVDREMLPLLVSTAQPVPGRTCYQGVNSLTAGTCLCIDIHGRQRHFTYDLVVHEDNTHLPLQKAASRLREQIEAAMQRCFQGFSEINMFLSGGFDTAVVAYEASKIASVVRGFHWTWDTPLFQDEHACAEQIAHHLGIQFIPVDGSLSIQAGGDYLRSMQLLLTPYNHAFFHCFDATARQVQREQVQILAGGHLGDTCFQGDWADPFRASFHARQPLSLLHTIINLLSWYPRAHAFTVLLYLLGKQPDLAPHNGQQRIQPCQAWLTPAAYQIIQEQGFFDYRQQFASWRHRSLSTQMVRVNLQDALEGETALDTALTTQVFLPRQILRCHPYADRQLLEFCLSLGPQHRQGFYGGRPITKLLTRLAYLNDLPPHIVRREVRSPYAFVAEEYCRQNQPELLDIFSAQSHLAQLDVIEPQRIAEIVHSSGQIQYHSRWLIRAAAVEIWLRTLSGEPLHIPDDTKHESRIRGEGKEKSPQQHAKLHAHLARICDTILAQKVNGVYILVNQQTHVVNRLNETGSFIWDLLLTEEDWEQATMHFQQAFAPTKSQEAATELLYNFAHLLAEQRWLSLHQPISTETFHALSPNRQ